MSPKPIGSTRHTLESCIYKLHSWKPFHLPTTFNKTLEKPDPTTINTPKPSSKPHKRPCLTDRTTSFSIEHLDMSKLSLFEEDGGGSRSSVKSKRDRMHYMARKRRRRGSRSVSGRSSDQSGTRRMCCSVGASNAYGTCSDFMMANNAGTDSSGELFVNGGGVGDVNWGVDVGEGVGRSMRRESGDRDNSLSGLHHCYGNLDSQGNESGYGSEPGYRGDAEFGYGDEFDEEEDDSRLLFWGNKFGGENTLAKAHHRCRRKKHELRMIDAV